MADFELVQATLKKELSTGIQDGGGRFKGMYETGTHEGDGIQVVEELADFETAERNTKNGDTPNFDVFERSRWCIPSASPHFGNMRDKHYDMLRFADPSHSIHKNAVKAFGRAFDNDFIRALFADGRAGKMGGDKIPFNPVMTVPHDLFGSDAINSSLTLKKLLHCISAFENLNIDTDMEEIRAGFPPSVLMDFLGTEEIANNDYNSKRLLEKGRIDDAVGIDFIQFNRLPIYNDGGTLYYRCPIWMKSGMYQGTWGEIDVDVGPRRDKMNNIQIYMDAKIGTVRLDERKVMELLIPVPTGGKALPKTSDFAWNTQNIAA